jgi:putative chitinase
MTIDRETQVLSDAYAAGIRSPKELANFMAQVTHESNGLNRLQESFRYTKGIAQIPVESAWRQGAQVLDSARKEALQGKPEKLAELMYGGRNGNDEPGDGYRYHGRGYIQLTGKANYLAAGKALNLDLVDKPELAADPKNASKIAVWYWQNRVPEAARLDVKAATKAVNGKFNGLQDRMDRFDAWEKRLTPEVMERMGNGEVGKTLHSPGFHVKGSTALAGAAALGAVALSEGAYGEDVRKLQSRLAELDYRDADNQPIKADGRYGRATRDAVKSAQRRMGLEDDGIAGPDLLIEMEQQRDVMEASVDFAPMPPTHRHGRHHRPLAPYGYAAGEGPGMCTAPMMNQPEHPHHALFAQAREAVHRLDEQHKRTPDTNSENLAAALTVAAHKEGMHRIDHAALSEDASRAFAVQGDPSSPHKRVAEVPTQQAVATPVAKSTEALDHLVKAAQPTQEHTQKPSPPSLVHGHGI